MEVLLAKRELTHALMRQNRRYSERCCVVALLQDRMRKWCEDLLDDLTLIDTEDIDYSVYRSHLRYLTIGIRKCWKDIEVILDMVYKDVGWLYDKLNVSEPRIAALWFCIAEVVNKDHQKIEGYIARFYRVHVLFEKTVGVYLEIFREQSLFFLFEKYRHY